jgi:hypothetical protein
MNLRILSLKVICIAFTLINGKQGPIDTKKESVPKNNHVKNQSSLSRNNPLTQQPIHQISETNDPQPQQPNPQVSETKPAKRHALSYHKSCEGYYQAQLKAYNNFNDGSGTLTEWSKANKIFKDCQKEATRGHLGYSSNR